MSTALEAVPWLCTLDEQWAGRAEACGGKTLGLHRLRRAGLPVPAGFCVTTAAFSQLVMQDAQVQRAIADLAQQAAGAALRDAAQRVRDAVLACDLPSAFATQITDWWANVTGRSAVAVRSSATAEDQANASFAGQQDTLLAIDSEAALLQALRRCWASLFSERAVCYRRERRIGDAGISMAVVIQCMVQADAAGVIFTADPLSGHRDVMVLEAVPGLGEALVSGHATPERYRVRASDGHMLERLGSDGQPLSDHAGLLGAGPIATLRSLGLRAQDQAQAPQDIEWAIEKGQLWLLQSRPITTLWPLPEGSARVGWRVFASFGHLQMNTAVMSRIGTSLIRRFMGFGRDPKTGVCRHLVVAGERLYIDTTPLLIREPLRTIFPALMAQGSVPISDRLQAAKVRVDLQSVPIRDGVSLFDAISVFGPVLLRAIAILCGDPQRERERFLRHLDEKRADQLARLRSAPTLGARLAVQYEELGNTFDWLLLRGGIPRVMVGLVTSKILAKLAQHLQPGVDVSVLVQGLEGNITTDMDLALAALADLARPHPALVAALRSDDAVGALAGLPNDAAHAPFLAAWSAFLDRFGGRCAGELDPQVARWKEDPRVPLRSIAGSLDRPAGFLQAQHASLSQRAQALRRDLIAAAQRRWLGLFLGPLVNFLFSRSRTLLGLREQAKFAMTHVLGTVRGLVLEAAPLLQRHGAIDAAEDAWLLELLELRDAVQAVERGEAVRLQSLIATRRALRDRVGTASPPAVYTSQGEILVSKSSTAAPAGTLVGTAVSPGTYEGIARVVHDPAAEELREGEILIARFTDPGWTPLFGHAGALVMEVGGQMTHGSVVARELGIPAVVAVEAATASLRSGDRVRVDGDRGWVTVLQRGQT